MQVTVLVLPDAHASSFPGLHNLETISDALIKKGIGVTIARDPEFVKGFGEDSAWQELQVCSFLRHDLCSATTRWLFLYMLAGMYGPCNLWLTLTTRLVDKCCERGACAHVCFFQKGYRSFTSDTQALADTELSLMPCLHAGV